MDEEQKQMRRCPLEATKGRDNSVGGAPRGTRPASSVP